jgi:hypothetical protein
MNAKPSLEELRESFTSNALQQLLTDMMRCRITRLEVDLTAMSILLHQAPRAEEVVISLTSVPLTIDVPDS